MIGQLDQALADCNESLRLSRDPYTLDSRGLVYLKLGQFDPAIADYTAVLKEVPNFADSLYGRGLAKRKKGDATGGQADVAAAKALRPDVAEEFAKYGVK
jgi:tetratricopeptide (TPR) repeat protein